MALTKKKQISNAIIAWLSSGPATTAMANGYSIEDSLPITSPSPLLTADLPSHALDVDADKSSTVASLSSAILGQRTIVVDLAHFEDDDESSSVATSLFVEVASVDEGGSYQGYGGASETEKYEIEGDDDETVITDNNSFYLGDSSYNRAPSSSGKRAAVRALPMAAATAGAATGMPRAADTSGCL